MHARIAQKKTCPGRAQAGQRKGKGMSVFGPRYVLERFGSVSTYAAVDEFLLPLIRFRMVSGPEYGLLVVQDDVVYRLDDVIGVLGWVVAEAGTGHVWHVIPPLLGSCRMPHCLHRLAV